MRFRRFAFVGLLATLLIAALGSVGFADPPPPGPVYMIISLDTDFEFAPGEPGTFSRTILVRIGSMRPAPTVSQTRFIPASPTPQVPIPPETAVADLNGHEYTVLGSFQLTAGDLSVHMLTPNPANPEAPIPPEVQAAFFAASVAGDLAELADGGEGGAAFPTTHAIATVVAGYLPGAGGEPSAQQVALVADHLFDTSERLVVTDNIAVDEGDMFPHTGGTPPLITYAFSFGDDGNFDSDFCLLVPVELDKNEINLTSNAMLKFTIFSTDDFDVSEVDEDTVEIGGVPADKVKFKDVDGDGTDDLQGEWHVGDLVDAGVLTDSSTELTITADLSEGGCVTGTDDVTIVKDTKKK